MKVLFEMGQVIGSVVGIFVSLLAMILFMSLLFSLPVMWLWNWLMPVIFGLKTLTMWQAWGMNILCASLFKSQITNKVVKSN